MKRSLFTIERVFLLISVYESLSDIVWVAQRSLKNYPRDILISSPSFNSLVKIRWVFSILIPITLRLFYISILGTLPRADRANGAEWMQNVKQTKKTHRPAAIPQFLEPFHTRSSQSTGTCRDPPVQPTSRKYVPWKPHLCECPLSMADRPSASTAPPAEIHLRCTSEKQFGEKVLMRAGRFKRAHRYTDALSNLLARFFRFENKIANMASPPDT